MFFLKYEGWDQIDPLSPGKTTLKNPRLIRVNFISVENYLSKS